MLTLLLQSCFLVRVPVKITTTPITDTVNVYHFVVTTSKSKLADSALINAYVKESDIAYNWISQQAAQNRQHLLFKQQWPANKDSTLRKNFVYKLPSTNFSVLSRSTNSLKRFAKKRTSNPKKQLEIINWQQNLYTSLATQVKDSVVAQQINDNLNTNNIAPNKNSLFVIHVVKAKKSNVLGFYTHNTVFAGTNKSRTIAHESLHHLGAPDLYIHKFFIGKRRHIVKKQLSDDIMNSATPGSTSCTITTLSNYTAYTIGWTNDLDPKYHALLKYNLKAVINFLIFGY
ncbi:MAG TPA: hypothetical protein VKG26_06700 [Bacteroidia bacterium]|nr:hypothetical protein [Bacteroidia bacterium]